MEIRVISFNIRCTNDPNGNSIAERAPRLAAVTAPYNADIIAFQENVPAWRRHIKAIYCDKYSMFERSRTAFPGGEGNIILWKKDRFACIKKGRFWFSDTPRIPSRGWDCRYNIPRICLYTVLREKSTGLEFTVMNTHFGFGDDGQVKSARLLRACSGKISEGPTIIVGDFNMTPQSAGYREMTEYFTDVNEKTAQEKRATFHGYSPEKVGEGAVDYCFAGEGVVPVDFCLLDDVVVDVAYYLGV